MSQFHIARTHADGNKIMTHWPFRRISPYSTRDASKDSSFRLPVDGPQPDLITAKAQFLEILTDKSVRSGDKMEFYQAYALTPGKSGKLHYAFANIHLILYKIAYGNEAIQKLRTEARLYGRELKKLQGTSVPMYLGYFESKIDDVDVECMVVESMGHITEDVTQPADNPSGKPIKQALVDAYVQIHKAGLIHRDWSTGMAFMHDEEIPGANVKIVGFDNMITEHECKGIQNHNAHTRPMDNREECCEELWDFCDEMHFWAAPYVLYWGEQVVVDPEFNVAKLVEKAPNDSENRGIWSEAGFKRKCWQSAFGCYIEYTKNYGPEKRHKELLEEFKSWSEKNGKAGVTSLNVPKHLLEARKHDEAGRA